MIRSLENLSHKTTINGFDTPPLIQSKGRWEQLWSQFMSGKHVIDLKVNYQIERTPLQPADHECNNRFIYKSEYPLTLKYEDKYPVLLQVIFKLSNFLKKLIRFFFFGKPSISFMTKL